MGLEARMTTGGRRVLRATLGVALLVVSSSVARSQEAPGSPRPIRLPSSPTGAVNVQDGPAAVEVRAVAALEESEAVVPARPKAVARFEGKAAPGSTIILRADGSTGSPLSFRWIQTDGPAVELGDPTRAVLPIRLPESAAPLSFVLVAGNASGVGTAPLTITVASSSDPGGSAATATLSKSAVPRADAGDDQVGLVGHLITLNGIRSEPRGRLAFRWIPIDGPAITTQVQDDYVYSFVPPAAGLYRFALVVATDGRISEPDMVDVMVGNAGPTATAPAAGLGPNAAAPATVEALTRSALPLIEGSAAVAAPLAEAFEAIADRMDLYATYADVFRETSLRLGAIIPNDPAHRNVWIARLFNPLTSRLIERMRAEGLDPSRPEGQTSPMTASQRTALADLYRAAARGIRATLPPL